jgi:hypothetical protein
MKVRVGRKGPILCQIIVWISQEFPTNVQSRSNQGPTWFDVRGHTVQPGLTGGLITLAIFGTKGISQKLSFASKLAPREEC